MKTIILFVICVYLTLRTSAKSGIRFCYDFSCDHITASASGHQMRRRFLQDLCQNYTVWEVQETTDIKRGHEEFFKFSIDYARNYRKGLCTSENKMVHHQLTPIERSQFHLYNLLGAALLTEKNLFAEMLRKPAISNKYYWLEFGVADGSSINITAKVLRSQFAPYHQQYRIYGFDNFTGLPEDWGEFKRGFFSREGSIPPVHSDVNLIKGMIEDTLPSFLAKHFHSCNYGNHGNSKQVGEEVPILAGVNIDVDIYLPSLFILQSLWGCMVPGTILHFHELFPRRNRYDELQALYEFAVKHSIILQILPYESNHKEATLVQVVSIG